MRKSNVDPYANSLAGWANIIKESGEQHRQTQVKIIAEKADAMRKLFDGQPKTRSKKILIWRETNPHLTTSTPDCFLQSNKVLAMVWDEMQRRISWLSDLESWLDS